MIELKLLWIMGATGCRWKCIMRTFNTKSLDIPISRTMECVIMLLYKNPDCTMSELSQKAGLEKSSFTRVADSLIKQGFAQREYNKCDRRKVIINLTDEGIEIAKKLNILLNEHAKTAMSLLNTKEKERLFELLSEANKILAKIKPINEENREYGK